MTHRQALDRGGGARTGAGAVDGVAGDEDPVGLLTLELDGARPRMARAVDVVVGDGVVPGAGGRGWRQGRDESRSGAASRGAFAFEVGCGGRVVGEVGCGGLGVRGGIARAVRAREARALRVVHLVVAEVEARLVPFAGRASAHPRRRRDDLVLACAVHVGATGGPHDGPQWSTLLPRAPHGGSSFVRSSFTDEHTAKMIAAAVTECSIGGVGGERGGQQGQNHLTQNRMSARSR